MVLTADQVTKNLAISRLRDGPVHLIGPLSLELEFNRGVAFSLGSGLGSPIIIIVVVVALLVVFLGRAVAGGLGAVALGLILGGACGNLADRIFRSEGGVVDFIHTSFWPTFNLADSAVVIGSLLLALSLLRGHNEGQRTGERT